MFEYTKVVIRSHKSKKDRYNGKKRKRIKEQTMIYKTFYIKTYDRAKRTPLETGDELRCSERLSSFCSTCGTRRFTLVKLQEQKQSPT